MKRSSWIAVGAMASVLVLAGAAYIAGRLLSAASQTSDMAAGPRVVVPSDGGGVIEAQLERAEELPDEPPTVLGFFARREDNRIFVSETTGDGIMIMMGEDGSISTNTGDTQIEVVVTSETAVYVDATAESVDESHDGGTIQQKLKPGSVEEIGDYSTMIVWGDKRDDRVVARVLLYTRPPVIDR